jgi:TetR/AcrR family transcriptional regulator, cholesterol catabolism regulator
MDSKKMELLEKCASVFLRLGIKSITMDDLARELGISKKTIYKYFKDKNELIYSIMQMKVELDCQVVAICNVNSSNAIEELLSVSEFIMEQLKNVTPTVFYDLKKYHPEAWQLMEEHKWQFVRNLIKENIDRGIKEGIYRDDIDALILSAQYVNSTDLMMDTKIFSWPQYKFQEVYLQLITHHLYGLCNTSGREYLKNKLSNTKGNA